MNNTYPHNGGQSMHAPRINVAAMAAIVQEFIQRDGSAPRDATELRERANVAGLNEHEYAAISALSTKLDTEGSAFLEPLRRVGWWQITVTWNYVVRPRVSTDAAMLLSRYYRLEWSTARTRHIKY